MIPENLIIDDYDIKTPNEIRDKSFEKFCDDMDIDKIMEIFPSETVENGDIVITTTKYKFLNVTIKRNSNGEILYWQTAFKVVE
tara:strand:- start:353 stop:604 length:252 start_codon:yes stop_codon:yes gene_type:complete